jgi:hypothetical protein
MEAVRMCASEVILVSFMNSDICVIAFTYRNYNSLCLQVTLTLILCS